MLNSTVNDIPAMSQQPVKNLCKQCKTSNRKHREAKAVFVVRFKGIWKHEYEINKISLCSYKSFKIPSKYVFFPLSFQRHQLSFCYRESHFVHFKKGTDIIPKYIHNTVFSGNIIKCSIPCWSCGHGLDNFLSWKKIENLNFDFIANGLSIIKMINVFFIGKPEWSVIINKETVWADWLSVPSSTWV